MKKSRLTRKVEELYGPDHEVKYNKNVTMGGYPVDIVKKLVDLAEEAKKVRENFKTGERKKLSVDIWDHLAELSSHNLEYIAEDLKTAANSHKEQEKKSIIERLSIDNVFGIYNRQGFQELSFPLVKHHITGIVFGDIDNLHQMNEQFGYEAVDEKIKASLHHRPDDIMLRWYSGDEIVWILLKGDVFGLERRIKHDFALNTMLITTHAMVITKEIQTWGEFLDYIKKASYIVRSKK